MRRFWPASTGGRRYSAGLAGLITMLVIVPLAAATLAFAAPKQTVNGPPNALQGFSRNRNLPIQIDAVSLEVRDKEKRATFAGKVHLVQGDTVLDCDKLMVFYDAEGKTAKSAKDNTAGQQNIRRIEVLGNVVVTQKDQKASAEKGVFDMKTNSITLTGNVVISQGQNVIRGDRLVVDMTTSVSRIECDKSSSCRVQALLMPGGGKNNAQAGGTGHNGSQSRTFIPFNR